MFPAFSVLGASRLLVLALPAGVVGAQHYTAVHAFYQVVLAILVVLAAHWLHRRHSSATYLSPFWALVIGFAGAVLIQLLDRGRLLATAPLVDADPQGVLTFLPAYMIGLLVAFTLVVGSRSLLATVFAAGGLLLIGIGLRAAMGSLAPSGFVMHPLVARLLGVALPALLAWWLKRRPRPTSYLDQWLQVGDSFPDLGGAASTDIYRRDEQLLLGEAFPALMNTVLLKTDLWDEARNTRILQWAAQQGAQVHGIDISLPTVIMARREFQRLGLTCRVVVADVRAIPYRDRSFNGVYSMGTVEHFAETQQAVNEIGRVSTQEGHVVLGVPNARDPFLRPVLVGMLQALGLYDYGDEKCYSHTELARICRSAGLQVKARSGILLQPGWLRMMDLVLHTQEAKLPVLAPLVRWMFKPFAAAYMRFHWLRRHGYLIAAIAQPVDTAIPHPTVDR